MIKPNWDVFKAKFSENSQDSFEWLCYILFCKEFKQEKGIFRFKNQSAIETSLIKIEAENIGWQAKFYDTSLSQKKDEILKTLENAKRDYPEVTKLLFYTNQEWGQSKGKTPKGLVEVEKKAKDLDIILEWRCPSYFEKIATDEERIFKHFFTLDKSVFDLIEELNFHTKNIFAEIQANIAFNGQTIEIDRTNELSKIKNTEQQVIVLSGKGGIGKTALIKSLYEEVKEESAFYLFKATEFELRSISEFFKNYNFQDFVDAHKEDSNKAIIIDSAEKLLDLKNTNPFKEFLAILVQNNWKIIFTTRDNYVDVLNTDFFEFHNIAPANILLKNLDKTELQDFSKNHFFQLPKDGKLLELIKNPFYLCEFLKYYKSEEELDYEGFKSKLWKKNITKTNPPRSECFQKIAFSRSEAGSFFVTSDDDPSILKELLSDGILGYEEDKGYFITHDIYEEWALEKIIKKEFHRKSNNQSFFDAIGQSLPIRRSFRNWISEQLLLECSEIQSFIEETMGDDHIDQSWKNEMLVSILLSDYSDYFFNNFKELLLADNQNLLKKATFWLRIGCKEIDDDFLKQFGMKTVDLSTLQYVLTKPKGNGWKSIIKFVFDNLESIGIENIHFILPIVNDWNSKFKSGETTRLSSLIALQYYQWLMKKGFFFSRDDDVKEKLFQTILYGSFEIQDELKKIIEKIVKNKWKNHRDPYHDFSETILTKLEGIPVSQVLPKYVLQLADLFWSFTPKTDPYYSRSSIDMEEYFDMEDEHFNYFPASTYQTPVYWLLQSSFQETVDFILQFTNKSVSYFAKTEFAKHEVEEIEVFIEKKKTVKQYNSKCGRLWNMYRGTSAPSPYILQSMHMALEKFFLESGKKSDSKTLEKQLLYLLENSRSTSISAVVISIVLAFPDKTFNVAKVLFHTKEFFLYETSRWVLDQSQKSQLTMLKRISGINSKNEIYENERLKACDDKHRKLNLETIFLQYQAFRNEDVTETEAKARQEVLWGILDEYYQSLPKETEQTESDQTWRMYLARMDYRKMKPSTKKTEEGIEIHWNPEIEPKLKLKNEESIKKNAIPLRYNALKLWAYYRMRGEDEYKKYEKYEKNPKLALKEAKEIISKIETAQKPKRLQVDLTEEESFYLFNYSIPGEVCSVLIRDFPDKLSQEEIAVCKDTVLEVASSSLKSNYQYQISDGVDSTILVLPVLLNQFPKERDNIKTLLLLTLFDDYPIGMGGGRFNHHSINAIHELWKSDFQDAQSLLLGYLLLKPKHEKLREKLREENYKKGIYELREPQVADKFLEDSASDLKRMIDNKITLKDCKNIENTKLSTLRTAFQLIPVKTENSDHKRLVKEIISIFATKTISNNREDKIDYMAKNDFLKKLAYFVLSAKTEEIEGYLKPFIDNLNNSEVFRDLFEQFILAEDQLEHYDKFWIVWNLFKDQVITLCNDKNKRLYTDQIVKSYLFATVSWKETATSWHTLKDKNKDFFKKVTQETGGSPSILYSILKLLNNIGSIYLEVGIQWVTKMLKNNYELHTAKLEVNTIYYMERSARKYIYLNRESIKKNKAQKDNILVILDFLIEHGSVVGYMLRDNIL